jgi:hypothetical protein
MIKRLILRYLWVLSDDGCRSARLTLTEARHVDGACEGWERLLMLDAVGTQAVGGLLHAAETVAERGA